MKVKNFHGIKFYETTYENYLISKCGKVYSLKRNKIMKPSIITSGYEKIMIKNKKIKLNKNVTVHRLVAETFIPNPNNLPCVNHIDGNKRNNDINNLEWCNQKENIRHSWDNKLSKYTKKGKKYCPVYATNKTSGFIYEFESIREAGRVLKVNQSNITKALKGIYKKCGNYEWGYLNAG